MLSSGPPRTSSAAVSHGGTLLPKCTSVPALTCSLGGAPRAGRRRALAAQAFGSEQLQDDRRQSRTPYCISCLPARQPGPQEDNCELTGQSAQQLPTDDIPPSASLAHVDNSPQHTQAGGPQSTSPSHQGTCAPPDAQPSCGPDHPTPASAPTSCVALPPDNVSEPSKHENKAAAAGPNAIAVPVTATCEPSGPAAAAPRPTEPDSLSHSAKHQPQQLQHAIPEGVAAQPPDGPLPAAGPSLQPPNGPLPAAGPFLQLPDPAHLPHDHQVGQPEPCAPPPHHLPPPHIPTPHMNGHRLQLSDPGGSGRPTGVEGGEGGGAGVIDSAPGVVRHHVIRRSDPPRLPPLRLDFLDWSHLQGSGASASTPKLPPGPPRRAARSSARRGRGGSGTRDERVRQLILSAATLDQLRAVVLRHLPVMSPVAAAIALSRLASLATATQRLAAAQQIRDPPAPAPAPAPAPDGTSVATSPPDCPSPPTTSGSSPDQPPEGAPSTSSGATRGAGPLNAKSATEGADRPRGGSGSSGPSAAEGAGRVGEGSGRDSGSGGRGGAGAQPVRLQRSSTGLIRRLLHHVARGMAPGGSGPGDQVGAGAEAATWRVFSPPDHRVRVAGTVLTTLARVQLRTTPEDRRALYDILEGARPDLFLATPLQLARLASSLPSLKLRPGPAWLDHFAGVARSKMYAAGPGELAACVWGMARLGYNPGDLWLHSLLQHLHRDGRLATASAGQLCQLLWSLHRLGFHNALTAEWRADVAGVVAATARAAAEGRAQPVAAPSTGAEGDDLYGIENGWLDGGRGGVPVAAELEGGGGGGVGQSPSDAASLLLWSVRCGAAPGHPEIEAVLSALRPALPTLRWVHLQRLLLALAESGCSPPPEVMAEIMARMRVKLPLLGAASLTQLLLTARQVRFVPSQSWLLDFVKASRSQLRYYSPSYVTATYQVFACWRLRPPRPYLEALHAYSDGLLPRFTPKGFALLLHSMSSLAVAPQRRWLVRALEVLADTMEQQGAGGGGGGAEGGADLGAGAGSARRQQRVGLAGVLVTGVCALRGILAAEGHGVGGGPQLGAGGTAHLQLAAVPPAYQGPGEATAAAASSRAVGEGGMSGAGAVGAQGGGGRGSSTEAAGAVGGALYGGTTLLPYELWGGLKRLTDMAGGLLDAMSGRDLARLILALSRLHFYPGREFLVAHAAATAAAGASLDPGDKQAVAAAYGHLAALAPVMAAEARRQGEMWQARTSVLMGAEPWV